MSGCFAGGVSRWPVRVGGQLRYPPVLAWRPRWSFGRVFEPWWSFNRVFEPRALFTAERRQGGLEVALVVVRTRSVRTRPRLDQQHRLGSEERDALPVAGDVGKRASEDAHALLIDPDGPDRAGGDHLSRQREVLAVQYQAVTDAAVGYRSSGQPTPGGPGARRLVVGDELNVDSGEPAQGVLVAFEHHDVDIGVVTRDMSHAQVDSPASGDPPGNGQAR